MLCVMNKKTIIGIILIGLSFFSIIPVLCNELANLFGTYCTTWEFFYTALPFGFMLFATGIFIIYKNSNMINRIKKPNRQIMIVLVLIIILPTLVGILYIGQPFFVDIIKLKHEYKIGEPIVFEIKADGFGNVCSEPHVTIFRIDRSGPQDGSNIIWSNNYQTGCIGNSQYQFFNNNWQIGDISDGLVIIDEQGKFKLSVSHGNRITEKEFAIIEP